MASARNACTTVRPQCSCTRRGWRFEPNLAGSASFLANRHRPRLRGAGRAALCRAPTGPDLRVLAVLQRDGRLVDFLEEEIDGYTDAQIGAAVRDIHRGCRKSLHDYLTIAPVINAAEEERVTIPSRFRPGRDPPGRQRQRLTALSGRAQASRLAGPLGPPAALAGRPRRHFGAFAGRGRDPVTPGRLPRREQSSMTVDPLNPEPKRTQTHSMSRYVVGIDLGTTNSALAYADGNAMQDDQPGPIASLPIPQVVAVNDVSERPLLPSFLYLPAAKEFPAGAFDLPWKSPPDRVARRLRARARSQGAGPAGQLGQELAFARRRRPPRADPALDGRRRCDQGLAGRGLGGLSRAPARRLERADSPARRPPTGSRTRRSS